MQINRDDTTAAITIPLEIWKKLRLDAGAMAVQTSSDSEGSQVCSIYIEQNIHHTFTKQFSHDIELDNIAILGIN